MNNNNQKTACIIGGGMSGLFTGALLAKNGYKVTVLEKNHIIGGGLQSFRRGDAVFNTGVEVFTCYDERFILRDLVHYLNLEEKSFQPIPMDDDAMEIVWVGNNCYKLPQGREKYEKFLVSNFPKEKDGIHNLLDSIFEIGYSFDIWAKKSNKHKELYKYIGLTGEQLIRNFIKDKNLIAIFNYLSLQLRGNLSVISAFDFGMIASIYIEGGWRFSGPCSVFVKEIEKCILNHGGEVLNSTQVNRIYTNKSSVLKVETINGKTYSADFYVGAIAPSLILQMSDTAIFRKATIERIETFNNDCSMSNIYITLKENKIPFLNSMIFVPLNKEDEMLPNVIAIYTPRNKHQGKYATTLGISIPTRYSEFSKWKNTLTGNRGEDYIEYKNKFAVNILNYVFTFFPILKNAISSFIVSTPLTIQDYYGNPNGAVYGQHGLFLPIKTKLDNLYMTGQAIQYPGLVGITLTSIITAETILGRNLIEEIAVAK